MTHASVWLHIKPQYQSRTRVGTVSQSVSQSINQSFTLKCILETIIIPNIILLHIHIKLLFCRYTQIIMIL